MPRDTQNKSIKKDNKSKSKKRDELTRRRKMNENSDSDDDSFINESDEEDETEEMDVVEYQKFLSKMFPSKYMNQKVKAGEDIKKFLKTLPNDESSSDE